MAKQTAEQRKISAAKAAVTRKRNEIFLIAEGIRFPKKIQKMRETAALINAGLKKGPRPIKFRKDKVGRKQSAPKAGYVKVEPGKWKKRSQAKNYLPSNLEAELKKARAKKGLGLTEEAFNVTYTL